MMVSSKICKILKLFLSLTFQNDHLPTDFQTRPSSSECFDQSHNTENRRLEKCEIESSDSEEYTKFLDLNSEEKTEDDGKIFVGKLSQS